jgi:hypothetical protein
MARLLIGGAPPPPAAAGPGGAAEQRLELIGLVELDVDDELARIPEGIASVRHGAV